MKIKDKASIMAQDIRYWYGAPKFDLQEYLRSQLEELENRSCSNCKHEKDSLTQPCCSCLRVEEYEDKWEPRNHME